MTLEDGTELSPALGIGAFIDKTLVAAGQCTKVDPAAAPEVAGLLGCGVMAGLGAAINTGNVGRGDSVAVIGCGGVGAAAIAGARLAGAAKIIAVDIDERKLATASELGATHTINSAETDAVEGIQALTDGNGADVVIDAVGRPETWQQAFYGRDLAGTVVLVGVPTPTMQLELPLLDVFGRGGSLKSSWYGDCLPSRDFPMLIDLYLQGRLPLDAFVTETIGIGDIDAAFEKMHGGEVLRSVVNVAADRRGSTTPSPPARSRSTGRPSTSTTTCGWSVMTTECVVIDAPHDVAAILEVVGERRVVAVLCTHAHDDHVRYAPELGRAVEAPVLLHPADLPVWGLTHDRRARTVSWPTVSRSRSPTSPWRSSTPPVTRRVRSASTPPTWAWCSPATPCSTVGPGRPGAPSATTT